MKFVSLILVLTVVCGSFDDVFAQSNDAPEIIISCGESVGYTYYHANAFLPKEESGWTKDKVTNGSFFIQRVADEYDLVFRDKLGLRSSKDDGAIIVPTFTNETSLSLVIIYPENGNTEVYNIQNIGSKDAEASWTSTKSGTMFVKSGVFHTNCTN